MAEENRTAPTRDRIKHAVYYAVASISNRSIANLEEGMILGGSMPKGVGMDSVAINATAGLLNIWIKHRAGNDTIRKGELTESTTLGKVIDIVKNKF
jgi:hypothetical protein